MADYDNKLSGALFKNDKGDNPKRPDYRGSYWDQNSVEYNVSAWMKISAKGVTFMSFKMQVKEAKPAAMQFQTVAVPNFQDDDEDKLPF